MNAEEIAMLTKFIEQPLPVQIRRWKNGFNQLFEQDMAGKHSAKYESDSAWLWLCDAAIKNAQDREPATAQELFV